MADINAIAEQIQGLTLLEASQLVKLLEEKLGVSAAAAAVAAPAAGGGAAAAAPVEEKTEFTVVLNAAGANVNTAGAHAGDITLLATSSSTSFSGEVGANSEIDIAGVMKGRDVKAQSFSTATSDQSGNCEQITRNNKEG